MGIKEFIYRKGTVGQTARHIGKVYLKLKPNTTVKTLNDNSFDKESLYSIILLQRAMSFINLSPTIYNNYIKNCSLDTSLTLLCPGLQFFKMI